jgi:predicted XRE-type DNA-binding protein
MEQLLRVGSRSAPTGLEQLRSILAARIIKALDEQELTVRRGEELTGFAAADFSRIRRANLDRFTVVRLMTKLNKLGQEMEVTISDGPDWPRSAGAISVHP